MPRATSLVVAYRIILRSGDEGNYIAEGERRTKARFAKSAGRFLIEWSRVSCCCGRGFGFSEFSYDAPLASRVCSPVRRTGSRALRGETS